MISSFIEMKKKENL